MARVVALQPSDDDADLVHQIASDCDAKVALARLAEFFSREAS